MRNLAFLAITLSIVVVRPALADAPAASKPAKAAKATTGTKPAKMTCEDFIGVEEVTKPKVVYWTEGFNRKGKAEDAVFDVESTERLVPVLVEECKKKPKESLVKTGAAVAKKSMPVEKPAVAAAKPAAAAAKPAAGAKPAKMTCQDFLEVDEVSKPKVIYWAEGFNGKGKPEDAVFDVESTERLVPVIVEECKKAPKESFWQKVKAEFKKIF